MPNIMIDDIMNNFQIDHAVFGQFSGFYYIGYCAAHIPIGIMLDRFGPKKVMTISILLTVVGLAPIIYANHFFYPIIGRFLIGVGSSAAILGAFKIIRIAFKEEHFTRMLSISVTIGLIGAIYGGGPISYLCKIYSYQAVVKIFAMIGILFALLTYLLVPEIKQDSQDSIIDNIMSVFTNKKVMLICVLSALMVGPLEGFADAWGSSFLKEIYGFKDNQSKYLVSIIYIGMLFAPLLSGIAEKTKFYFATIAGAGILMLVIFTLLVLGLLNSTTIIPSFFIVGICCAYQILSIYKASTYVTENLTGLTTAVANMIIMSFGYIFHSLIGVIIKNFASAGMTTSFKFGVGIIPVALLIGSLGFLVIAYREKT
jgi:predicted MFS family arabinose efflux permease